MDNLHCYSCLAPGDFSHRDGLCTGCIHMWLDIRKLGYDIRMLDATTWEIADSHRDGWPLTFTVTSQGYNQPFTVLLADMPEYTVYLPSIASIVAYFEERRSSSPE